MIGRVDFMLSFICQNQFKSLVLLSLLIKFSPLDSLAFHYLNNSLALNIYWAKFWALLNHRWESLINVFVMLGVNFLALSTIENRAAYIKRIFGAIIILELAILSNYIIFSKIYKLHRLSPSLVYNSYVSLRDVFGYNMVKIATINSFPSGHALVAVYWALVSKYIMPTVYHPYVFVVAFFLCISRLFPGAHWLSDIIGTSAIALLWFRVYVYARQMISGYQITLFKNKYF